MKKFFAVLFATLLSVYAWAENKLEVIKIEAPAAVAPGQNVSAHITFKVLEFDGKPHLRPGGYYNFAKSKNNANIPRTNTIPWRLRNFKVGDTLKYTVKFTVPETVIAGEKGLIAFRLSTPGKKGFVKLIGKTKAEFTVKAAEKLELAAPVPSADSNLPVACVPILNEAPQIDGKCDEKVWAKAAVLPVKTNSMNGKAATHAAELKIFTDGKYIYAAMLAEVSDNQAPEIKKFPMHDGKVWINDSLECFFTPDIYLMEYRHFIADLLGQHYDSENGDYHGFNPIWRSVAQWNERNWTIEAAIPVDAITKNKIEKGTIWRGGFFRYSERGRNNSAWASTLGSHNSVSRHGYLFFGSLQDVLNKQSAFIAHIDNKSSQEMQKLAAEVKALCSGSVQNNASELPKTLKQLGELRKKFDELAFSENFAKSELPLVIQSAFPYSGTISPESKVKSAAVHKVFFPGEVQDLAWNITNISNKTITIHAGLFGIPADKFTQDRKSRDFLIQGINGFPEQMFTPAPAAAFDGRNTFDVLAPNPAGVLKIAPRETVQLFLRVRADGSAANGNGSLVLEGIDNGAMTLAVIPVSFELCGTQTLSAGTKPFVFGWDYIPEKIAAQRPEFVRNHYNMLREYGFNTMMLVGLRHFPRPKADKQGNLIGKMDFSILKNHLARVGTDVDHCYWDLAIWEKQSLRKDLFGLDFYTPAYEKAFKAWFSACVDALLQSGIPNEKLLVCPVDECSDKRAETIARWVKECRPATRIILDSSRDDMVQVKSIDRYVDVWMPHYRTLQQAALNEFHKYLVEKGKKRFLYYYCAGGNEKLKDPYKDYILNFYGVFARGFEGLGYWAAGQYYGSPWYRRAYARTGDTALVYPVKNGTIPSRRLAAWYRGVQDLWLLRETAYRYRNNAQIQTKLREAAQNAVDYPNDPARAEALRQYCRKLLANTAEKAR